MVYLSSGYIFVELCEISD